ncbi:MAG: hypothetical protein AAGG75_11405 [Bacteroidota bacterium]
MNIDVSAYISELLFKHDAVAIPGLGGLVTVYKPSTIDHVQGLLYPPSKSLSFDRELMTDDGVLIGCIRKKNDLSAEEAQKILQNYVAETQSALEKREIVVFPNVGRLYKDYEQNFQFLQDNTNFNTDAFGLPAIQFYPILRNRGSIFAESELGMPAPAPEVNKKQKSWKVPTRQLQSALPAVFLIALLSLSVYFFTNRASEGSDGFFKKPVAGERLNRKPSDNQASLLDVFKSREEPAPQAAAPPVSDETEEPALPVDEDGEFETAIDTEAITTLPGQKEAVIIIGAYGKKAGVKKRIKQLYDLGYDAYQDKLRGLTRVGAQFSYEEEEQLEETLRLLRQKFDKSAYLLKD